VLEARIVLDTAHWISYQGSLSGAWSNPNHWDIGRQPAAADDAVIDASGADYTVSVNATANMRGLTVNSSNATLLVAGQTISTSVEGADIEAGHLLLRNAHWQGSGAGLWIFHGASMVVEGSSFIQVFFVNEGQLQVQGDSAGGDAKLTTTSFFSSTGTVTLTSIEGPYASDLDGYFENLPAGTLSVESSSGGPRRLTSDLTNDGGGSIFINTDTIFNKTPSFYDNAGAFTIAAGHTLTLDGGPNQGFRQKNGSTLTINGTLAMPSGYFHLDAGTVNINGTLSLSSATLNLNDTSHPLNVGANGTLALSGATVSGPSSLYIGIGGTLALSGSTVNPFLTNDGAVTVSGDGNVIAHPLFMRGTIGVSGLLGTPGSLQVGSGFTNSGTIELVSTTLTSATLTVDGGTLTNVGTITTRATGGIFARFCDLEAQLDNRGSFTVAAPTDLGTASASHLNSGTISINAFDLTVNQSGTNPSFTNTGTISIASDSSLTNRGGTFNHNGGNLNGPGTFVNAAGATLNLNDSTVQAAVNNQGLLVATGNTALNGQLTTATGSTLRVTGGSGTSRLTVLNGFTNNGTIEVTSTGATSSALTVNDGTLTNAAGASLSFVAGGQRQLDATLDNQGIVTIAAPTEFYRYFVTHTNSGSIVVQNVTWTMPAFSSLTNSAGAITLLGSIVDAGIVNQGLIVAQGISRIDGPLTTTPGSTLRVTGPGGTNTLTVPHTLTNYGAIEVTGTGVGNSTLAVSNGPLINMPGATIGMLSPPEDWSIGGARVLDLELDNRGTLTTVGNPYTQHYLDLDTPSTVRHHSNSGTINVGLYSSFSVTLQPGSTFDFSGTLNTVQQGGNMIIAGQGAGTFYFDWHAGTTMTGPGQLGLLGLNVRLQGDVSTSPRFGNVALVGGTVNGPGTLTNSSDASVGLGQNEIINTPLLNQGYLGVLSGRINGPLTTDATSTISMSHVEPGTLTVADGFTNHGIIRLTSYYDNGPATLEVTSGVLVNAADGRIEALIGAHGGPRALNATLANYGTVTINANTTVMGSIINYGSLTIGPGATFTVTGNYMQTDTGVLHLTGLHPGAGAPLQINGAATLDGTLNVAIDYTTSAGDRLLAMNFGSRSGVFARVTGYVGPGLDLDPQYDATSLTLVVYST
jgi:hypothetical protein